MEFSLEYLFVPMIVTPLFGTQNCGQLGFYKTNQILIDHIHPMNNLLKGELIKQMGAGFAFSMLLTNLNRLLVSGNNHVGQLGLSKEGLYLYQNNDGIRKQTDGFIECVITILKPNEIIEEIIVGAKHCLLRTNHHRLLACGDNSDARLGHLAEDNQKVEGFKVCIIKGFKPNETIKQVSTGINFTLLLTTENRVFVTGCSRSGQLGVLKEIIEGFEERIIKGLDADEIIIKIVAGTDCSLLLTNKNRLLVSGNNEYCKLGLPYSTETYQFVVCPIPTLKEGEFIMDMVTGFNHTLLYTNQGTLFGSGRNHYGELGFPKNREHIDGFEKIPLTCLAKDETIAKMKAGRGFSLLTTNRGRLLASGNNYFYQTPLPLQQNYYGFEVFIKHPKVIKTENKTHPTCTLI